MPTRSISRRIVRRIMLIILILAIACAAFGAGITYAIKPGQPYIFVHLPRGGYIAEYRTREECFAARKAFAAGRGIDTSAPITISKDYADVCSRNIPELSTGAPAGHLIDVNPEY